MRDLTARLVPTASAPRVARSVPPRLCTPATFEAYYRAQSLLPDAELTTMFEQLGQPLPLDVRASARAALADRALDILQDLQLEEEDAGRALTWAGERAWQWPTCAKAARAFVHEQQLRGSLQRQESASMLPALVLSPRAAHAVLDMCAAPGSKSIQMLELMERDRREQASASAEALAEVDGGGLSVQAALAMGVLATAIAEDDGLLPSSPPPSPPMPSPSPPPLSPPPLPPPLSPPLSPPPLTPPPPSPPRGFLVANDASLPRSISLTHRLTSVNAAPDSFRLLPTPSDSFWLLLVPSERFGFLHRSTSPRPSRPSRHSTRAGGRGSTTSDSTASCTRDCF